MFNKLLAIKRKYYSRKTIILISSVIVALVGVIILGISGASGNFIATEAETGYVRLPAMQFIDANASSGEAVEFKQESVSSDQGCRSGDSFVPCVDNGTGTSWTNMVFSDEFSGTSLDTNKWAPCFFPGAFPGSDVCGKMNDSQTLKSNVRVESGNAVLRQTTVAENDSTDKGALIMSLPSEVEGQGFVMTDGHFAEARVYFPGNGTNCYNWPAWWINGNQSGFGDGEIDVAEIGGTGRMTSNYHFDRGNGREITQFTIGPGSDWCDTYHIYGVDRRQGLNVIYVDGQEVTRYPTYDGGAEEYLIFNVGYKSGKTPKAGPASDVKIDYVRVWKK